MTQRPADDSSRRVSVSVCRSIIENALWIAGGSRPELFDGPQEALADCTAAPPVGFHSADVDATPKQIMEEFYKQDPESNLDRIFERLIPEAPAVKQAEAKLLRPSTIWIRPS